MPDSPNGPPLVPSPLPTRRAPPRSALKRLSMVISPGESPFQSTSNSDGSTPPPQTAPPSPTRAPPPRSALKRISVVPPPSVPPVGKSVLTLKKPPESPSRLRPPGKLGTRPAPVSKRVNVPKSISDLPVRSMYCIE